MKFEEELFNLRLINYGPSYKDFSPDYVIASFTRSVFGRNVEKILEDINISKASRIIERSAKRGHGSIYPMSVFWFVASGSRFLDKFLTPIPHGNFLVLSSRFAKLSEKNSVIPRVLERRKELEEYKNIVRRQYNVYENLQKEGIPREATRKILGSHFFTQVSGLIPLNYVFALEYLYRRDQNYWPYEICLLVNRLNEIAEKISPMLYEAGKKFGNLMTPSWSTIYKPSNKSLGLNKSEIEELLEGNVIVKINEENGAFEEIYDLVKTIRKSFDSKNPNKIALSLRNSIENLNKELYIITYFASSIAVNGEVKRHRTMRRIEESIIDAINDYLSEKEKRVHAPPHLRGKEKREYLECFEKSISLYQKLIRGISCGDALRVVPEGLKVIQKIVFRAEDLLHPFGFFGRRSCSKAEYEMREISEKIVEKILEYVKENYEERVYETLKKVIGPTCKIGYCPEVNFCQKIFEFNPRYGIELHKLVNRV